MCSLTLKTLKHLQTDFTDELFGGFSLEMGKMQLKKMISEKLPLSINFQFRIPEEFLHNIDNAIARVCWKNGITSLTTFTLTDSERT